MLPFLIITLSVARVIRECNPDLAGPRSREIPCNFSGSIPKHNMTRSRSRLTGLGGNGQRCYTHPLAATATQSNPSLQEELEETLRASKSDFTHVSRSTSLDKLESVIKKEMDLFECGGTRGRYLQFAYNCLITLLPTSVESERAFSAAGYIARDIRCRLADSTLDTLCFLRSYFQNHP